MCLVINKKETTKLKKKVKYIIGYKVYVKNTYHLQAPYRTHHCVSKYGVVKSNREKQKIDSYERMKNRVYRGIHIFRDGLTADVMRDHMYPNTGRVVKVRCYLKDLVAADENQAVFMKVTILKAEWSKIFGTT